MLRHIELQPLEASKQRNGVCIDIRRRRSGGWRPIEIGIDDDLLLREIGDQHVLGPRSISRGTESGQQKNPAGWSDVRAFVVRMRRLSGALGWLLGCGFAVFVAIHIGPFTVSIFVSQ